VTLDEVRNVRGHLLRVKWGYAARELQSFLETQKSPMIELPIDTIRHMLLCNVGGAFLPRSLVADELAMGRLVELAVEDFPTCYRESALVCLKTGMMSAALSDFVTMLREEAGEVVVNNLM